MPTSFGNWRLAGTLSSIGNSNLPDADFWKTAVSTVAQDSL